MQLHLQIISIVTKVWIEPLTQFRTGVLVVETTNSVYNYVTLECIIRVNDCSIRVFRSLDVEGALSHLALLVLCQYW